MARHDVRRQPREEPERLGRVALVQGAITPKDLCARLFHERGPQRGRDLAEGRPPVPPDGEELVDVDDAPLARPAQPARVDAPRGQVGRDEDPPHELREVREDAERRQEPAVAERALVDVARARVAVEDLVGQFARAPPADDRLRALAAPQGPAAPEARVRVVARLALDGPARLPRRLDVSSEGGVGREVVGRRRRARPWWLPLRRRRRRFRDGRELLRPRDVGLHALRELGGLRPVGLGLDDGEQLRGGLDEAVLGGASVALAVGRDGRLGEGDRSVEAHWLLAVPLRSMVAG
mmetsp:Transcript_6872/g.19308  ORF Transcript_6872/g.19308 Transcript_6872/m.19308 type:complete len:294 (-) Transcript_6872:80-961(-)